MPSYGPRTTLALLTAVRLLRRPAEEDAAIAAAGGGSSDMGNVSHIMPSIHPSFKIDTKFGNRASQPTALAPATGRGGQA